MHETGIGWKRLFLAFFAGLFVLLFLFLRNYFDTQTRLVFCDVGQGDGAFIRVKNRVDVVIDAGPDNKILQCLGRYMPFFDRTIDIAILTHPQKDHYFGFISLLDRYKVKRFFLNNLESENYTFQLFKKKLRERNVSLIFPTERTRISILTSSIDFVWPTEEFLKKNVRFDKQNDSFGKSSLDPNNFSLIFVFKEDNFRVLFTGDTSKDILDRLSERLKASYTLLKVPHHGSKHGLSVNFLQLAHPAYGVISSGKNNSYGHPAKETLDILEASRVKVRRTDIEGDIIFIIE